ncbi:PadR family transcriptional regulator [Glaciihabitans sp. INWT7]|uniref:PadR family transcriptional regulator n=1 Tax=Glaciihabitans sp. INWT7 TaxID=2596912 RepID=UPI0016262097|nr:PadR family transcriptional regulator [Glaciihabitans sp. INWT7]QNE46113.1 PadR family transcriptional regulator [Glaciihabitans sp. INWT7]
MTVDVGAQLRKGVVEYCILGLLAAEPTYGWQLSEALVSRGLIASIGTLYPILGRLRTQGLVSGFDRQSDAGPSRRYYRVTETGHLQLAAFREQWGPFARTVQELVGEDTP